MENYINKVIQGDCLEKLKELEDNSVDAIVTDPPYGLSFMGKKWDYDVPSQEIWEECLRVLKPGGYLLAFAGTRTQHRMAVRIEDSGFEIRDMIAWVYGSGFPKSLNIGKALDGKIGMQGKGFKSAGDDGRKAEFKQDLSFRSDYGYKFEPQSKEAKEWEGWGTALKPALEPITVARKPLSEKTVAENCLKWGVGGINIDQTRVPAKQGEYDVRHYTKEDCFQNKEPKKSKFQVKPQPIGRFPSNLIHDGSDEVVSLFPNDSQRFFYCAKAGKSERNMGCEGLEEKVRVRQGLAGEHKDTVSTNSHPTVKPIALMEYLVKLVSREGAVVLDPFAGSGSTLLACKKLGRNYIGIELDPEYIKIAEARLKDINNTLF